MPTTAYLLDTNIITALVRDPQGVVATTLHSKMPAMLYTSIVVASEIEFGLCKGVSERMRRQVLAVLASLEVLPLGAPVHQHYGQIRCHLMQLGQPIGPNDLFIAAQARALDMVLVSNNVREFQRVPGLRLENWLDG
jgi:tRNA(fMet)-specific endonuclease VapC